MCVVFFPFSVGYASFSFLLLIIIRFLVYGLITTCDWTVSIPYTLQRSQLSVAKENRDIEVLQTPKLYLKPSCLDARTWHYCPRDTI